MNRQLPVAQWYQDKFESQADRDRLDPILTILQRLGYVLVVIHNSKIGSSQVINDTYPDPRYRLEADIGVAYGSDYHQVRRVITDAVRGVEGVLPDRPVDVFFLNFGDSDRTMRVRWWIDTIDHKYRMLDRVNAALENALDEAGIDMPLRTYALNVKLEGDKASSE